MEAIIDRMKKSEVEKDSSIALTETRLRVRNQRPNSELVRYDTFRVFIKTPNMYNIIMLHGLKLKLSQLLSLQIIRTTISHFHRGQV